MGRIETGRDRSPAIEEPVASGSAGCRAPSVPIAADTVRERRVRGARHDFPEGFLKSVAPALPPDTGAVPDDSLLDPEGPTGFRRITGDPGAAPLASSLDACDRAAFPERLDLAIIYMITQFL